MLQVRKLCKQRGISLKELAETMNIPPESLTRMLSANGNPTLSSLVSMAKALNVEVYELFDDFNADKKVRGYLEVGDEIYRINSFGDLKDIFNKLSIKE